MIRKAGRFREVDFSLIKVSWRGLHLNSGALPNTASIVGLSLCV